jgi:hypothetical protein
MTNRQPFDWLCCQALLTKAQPLLLMLLLCCAMLPWQQVAAEQQSLSSLPAALQPWLPWVQQRHPTANCPWHQEGEARQCTWPVRTAIEVSASGGQFQLEVLMFSAGWLALPGDIRHWPQQVQIEALPLDDHFARISQPQTQSVPALIRDQQGQPQLQLPAGRWQINGLWQWPQLPAELKLPPQYGVLSLKHQDSKLQPAMLDVRQQRLQLAERNDRPATADSLQIQVQQLLTDDIPGQLTTLLQLDVGGQARQLVLPAVLPAGFSAVELDSDIPALFGADGSLTLQLQAGQAQVRLQSQTLTAQSSIEIPQRAAPWPKAEIWAFAARPQFRTVQLSGGSSLDPAQTSVPADWQQYPLLLLQPGEKLSLTEQQRAGTSRPVSMALQKKLWLNFNGGQLTIRDQIDAKTSQHSRLDASAGYLPGRIEIDGKAQLITQLTEQQSGVEIRQSSFFLQALTTLPLQWHGLGVTLPVSGWQQEFANISWQLVLPPGWSLLTASRVDQLEGSWLQRWDLWDIFFVMLVSAGCAKLLQWQVGLLAFVCLVLSYHRPDAPQWLWLSLLVLLALQRIASGKWAAWLQKVQLLNAVLLLLVLGNFAVSQLRQAIYPQLEQPWQLLQADQVAAEPAPAAMMTGAAAPTAVSSDASMAEAAANVEAAYQAVSRQQKALSADKVAQAHHRAQQQQLAVLSASLADPQAKIQTGPAQPEWSWRTVGLDWHSPVRAGSETTLYLVPAWLNRLGNLVCLLLLGWLSWLLLHAAFGKSWQQFQQSRPQQPTNPSGHAGTVSAIALVLCSLLLPTPAPVYSTEFPPAELLTELEQRLLSKPECLPNCSSIEQLQLTVADNQAQIRLQLHSQLPHSWPLPVPLAQLTQISIDQQAAALWLQDEQTVLLLPKGRFWLQLTLNLTNQQQLTIQLPQPWHQLSQQLTGWQAEAIAPGNDESQLLQQRRSLTFNRLETSTASTQSKNLPASSLEGSAVLFRTLELGLQWRLHSRFERQGKLDKHLTLALPLLPGEQPLSALPQQQGVLQLQLDAGQAELNWSSALPKTSKLQLTAATQQPYVEIWQIAHSSKYHLQSSGVPAIEQQSGHFPLQFQPWPGEQLSLEISEPATVPADNLTIRSVSLKQQQYQGFASTTFNLSIDSGQAQPFSLHLPPGASLKHLQLDDSQLALQSADQSGKVSLALKAGLQQLQLSFEQQQQSELWRQTPALTLPTSAGNLYLQLQLPADRWLLAVGGPAIGPAILFWGMLVLLLGLALVLPRVIRTPLQKRHWCLLFAGLSTLSFWLPLLLSLWLAALSWRGRQPLMADYRLARLSQLLLILVSLVALVSLLLAIPYALLSSPQIYLTGNGSSAEVLYWYQDQSPTLLSQAWALTLPLWCYQLAMLLWSLWLAAALMQWLPWAWRQLSFDGFWPGPLSGAVTVTSTPTSTESSAGNKT